VAGDLVHGDVQPALGEELARGPQDPFAVAGRVTAQRALWSAHAESIDEKRRNYLRFAATFGRVSSPTSPPPASGPSGAGLDRDLMMVASVVVLGAIMSILDVTVVNVAINTLAQEFDTTLPTIQWVATGYTLALATVIPLTGWAADRFGTKRLYMISLLLFVLGSVLSPRRASAR
jgi:hypothetical protein